MAFIRQDRRTPLEWGPFAGMKATSNDPKEEVGKHIYEAGERGVPGGKPNFGSREKGRGGRL